MNQHHQNILDLIQQEEGLTTEQKIAITKSLKNADKELEIVAFKLDRTEKVKRTTAILLEETIQELEHKRKAVEAQNRELEIESSLERVRTVAMGMNKSDDMLDVCHVISDQLKLLQIQDIRNVQTLVINEKKFEYINYQYFTPYDKNSIEQIDYRLHPVELALAEKMLSSPEAVYIKIFEGKDLQVWRDHRRATHQLPDPLLDEVDVAYYYFYSIGSGAIGITAYSQITEEQLSVFRRFRNVFELTYRRYRDIEQAAAQAREAIKRASVDRVRADIASMRTTNDLERIQPLIWNELTTLGVPFIRCGVFIMDEGQQKVHTFLSTPEGKAIATLHVPFDFHLPIIYNGVSHWRDKKIYKEYWDATLFIKSWTALSSLRETSAVSDQQEQPPENLHLHLLPFLQGMLYVGNEAPLKEEELQLVQNLADAFSTAYARYEDFNKLESAKSQIEKTLADLKQAQSQLIQSEKMASLGELTAGIAHEIQNPLNFVNNFSEVSTELLDEMIAELGKSNPADAIAIAEDVKQNLEKILHHGKRADGIVKGMLQHSRTSSGVKEPTNINILADEYLRLAYHGLRAKDKSFNAVLKTNYDETIRNVEVIPQDIGRVILNLITNAFYAVEEKRKIGDEVYKPTVSVSTKKVVDKVEVSVKDNGIGISRKVMDKIFQPFFTTKPTGQGTGLGLSLSYDIIKAHGGELKVETGEGEGSEFVISLPA